jgi:soluble lytic murein transglycosylase
MGPPVASDAPVVRESEVAAIAATLSRRPTGLTAGEVDAVARTIVVEARRYALEPSLVLAVMHVESRFYNFAVSPVGAIGLMQVMPDTGAYLAARIGIDWVGPQTLFDPTTNVRLGVAYLRELSDRYGSLATALAAYNWGPGRIDRRLRLGTALPDQYPNLVLEAYAERRGHS